MEKRKTQLLPFDILGCSDQLEICIRPVYIEACENTQLLQKVFSRDLGTCTKKKPFRFGICDILNKNAVCDIENYFIVQMYTFDLDNLTFFRFSHSTIAFDLSMHQCTKKR